MHVGMSSICENPQGTHSDPALDAAAYALDYELADRAEALGFDSLFGVEHHFNGYSMCPDPFNFLNYFAGRTKTIRLGSMAVIVPWHDPVRVAENISVLDLVSGGRLVLGVGRGVAKGEFDGFRVDQNQARERLFEGMRAIQTGVDTGVMEYDGEVVKQPRVQIRPHSGYSLEHRVYCAAGSASSFPLIAKEGWGLLLVPGMRTWDEVLADLEIYREVFRTTHGREAPGPIVAGWVFVDEVGDRARDKGTKFLKDYLKTALAHYDFSGEHIQNLKGYESYAADAKAAEAIGWTEDNTMDRFILDHVFGTPDECFEKIKAIRDKLGAAAYLTILNYIDMGREEALRNQTLFAQKVLPRLKAYLPSLDIGRAPEAAELKKAS